MKKRIKLRRIAMNIECVMVADLIIKLKYVLSDKEKPELQIFKNSEKAQANDWQIYGFPDYDDKETERVNKFRFDQLNQTFKFKTEDGEFTITFVNLGKEDYQYPKLREEVYFYEFEIEKN